jgi:hypothetical protein
VNLALTLIEGDTLGSEVGNGEGLTESVGWGDIVGPLLGLEETTGVGICEGISVIGAQNLHDLIHAEPMSLAIPD